MDPVTLLRLLASYHNIGIVFHSIMPPIRSTHSDEDRISTKSPTQPYGSLNGIISRFSVVKQEAPRVPVKLHFGGPPVPRKNRRRDIGAEFIKITGGSKEKQLQWLQEIKDTDYSGKSRSTSRIESQLGAYLLQFLEHAKGAEDETTGLAESASALHPEDILNFIKALRTLGSSGIGRPGDGWDLKTTKIALFRFLGMLKSQGVAAVDEDEFAYIVNGLTDGILTETTSREAVTEPMRLGRFDYDALMSAVFSVNLKFESNFHRVQFAAILGILWETGSSPEHFVKLGDGDRPRSVRLGECRLVVERMTDDGPEFTFTMTYRQDGFATAFSHFPPLRRTSTASFRNNDSVRHVGLRSVLSGSGQDDHRLCSSTIHGPLKEAFEGHPLTRATRPITSIKAKKAIQDNFPALSLTTLNQDLRQARDALGWANLST
ncbi:hypothetical protein D9619_010111 [Psilocybe cf. subviscida]|uniref:Uncharacterized protein n=1 Tax=Psilocybe cf. subviscida TaxID=2480587 RepID=A0A8H5BKV1_9AGAR|nr:hypothetical protein D9619_010111 [Psilocybe cf. subviscida]